MIRKIRRERDVTQFELANQIGVERSTVTKWETGKSKPTENKLMKIAVVLNCTVDDLLREDGDHKCC